jgi:two-component system cell cycle sensor histidine kinase/response regulator CckA
LHNPPSTILLVEDDAQIRDALVAWFSALGYRIVGVGDSAECFRVLKNSRIRVDLLISDVDLPEMSGPELARKLKRSHPNIRVLFISGRAPDRPTETAIKDLEAVFLRKPFSTGVLTRTVESILKAR